MKVVDAARTRYVIPAEVLAATNSLLAEPGIEGFEGSVLWLGHVVDATTAHVERVHRPEQVGYATPAGLAVELTQNGLTDLIMSMTEGEIVLARLHTHGNHDVNHSPVDDANLVVGHPGAVSIVVPYFASHGIELTRCGVHILSANHRWRRLSRFEVERRFEVR